MVCAGAYRTTGSLRSRFDSILLGLVGYLRIVQALDDLAGIRVTRLERYLLSKLFGHRYFALTSR